MVEADEDAWQLKASFFGGISHLKLMMNRWFFGEKMVKKEGF